MTMAGLLVALEGIDGSGKGTQARLLHERLHRSGISSTIVAFPRYDETLFGRAIARYLNGEFGPLDRIPAEFAALLFAGDRFESRPLIERCRRQYACVIFDRYVPSNVAHQGARVPAERWDEFRCWLERIEYDVYELPRPDAVIWLDVSPAIAQQLVGRKGTRRYTELKADLHEADREYLSAVRRIYGYLAQQPGWHRVPVEGDSDGTLRSVDAVHRDVWRIVEQLLLDRTHCTTR